MDIDNAKADAMAYTDSIKPNDFELIASGTTTEEVNSIIISQDNDGNPLELCDMITIYTSSPIASVMSAVTVVFDGTIIHQIANGIHNTNISLTRLIAIHSGKRWDVFATSSFGSGGNGNVSSRMRGFSEKEKSTVKQIKLYLYNSANVLPVGFKYEIYGRRVKK